MLYRKIFNLALFVTSIFAFFVAWPLVINLPYHNEFVQFLAFFVSASGFFNIFTSLAVYILEKIPVVKKTIFGLSYFEGKWIGYYAKQGKRPYIFYVVMGQTLEHTHFSASIYSVENKRHKGVWKSTGEVTINPLASEMSFLYEINMLSEKTPRHGLFQATFYKKGIFKTPWRIKGFAVTPVSGIKNKVEMKKVSNSSLVKDGDEEKLLQEALEFCKDEIAIPESHES